MDRFETRGLTPRFAATEQQRYQARHSKQQAVLNNEIHVTQSDSPIIARYAIALADNIVANDLPLDQLTAQIGAALVDAYKLGVVSGKQQAWSEVKETLSEVVP